MVTMLTKAAFDYSLIHTLLQHGMACMRINCVRDDADIWLRIIEHLHRAEQALGRFCRVMMDLGGSQTVNRPIGGWPCGTADMSLKECVRTGDSQGRLVQANYQEYRRTYNLITAK